MSFKSDCFLPIILFVFFVIFVIVFLIISKNPADTQFFAICLKQDCKVQNVLRCLKKATFIATINAGFYSTKQSVCSEGKFLIKST